MVEEKPLIYSCSGCSTAAQMANYLAIQLDRKGMEGHGRPEETAPAPSSLP